MTRIALDALVQITASLQTQFEQADPTIPANVMVRCDDTGLVKIGDGVTVWSLLPNWYEETFTTDMKNFLETHNEANAILVLNGNGKVSVDYLPTSTTSQRGIVQLSDATDSDDSTKAASSKAVKLLADMIQSGGTGSGLSIRPQTLVDAPASFLVPSSSSTLIEDAGQILTTHTTYASTSGTASATSEGSLGKAWNAFDKSATTGQMFSGQSGTLKYVLNTPTYLMGYWMSATFANNWPIGRSPKDWTIYVGAGNTPDILMDTKTAQTWSTFGQTRKYMFANPLVQLIGSFEARITANVSGSPSEHTGVAEFTPVFGTVTMTQMDLKAGIRAFLSDGNGGTEEWVLENDVTMSFITSGGVPVNGYQYILAGPEGCRFAMVGAGGANELPTYDYALGRWSDNKKQIIVGWVQIINGAPANIYQRKLGIFTELEPSGTTLPNPFIGMPIVAIQDTSIRPIVNNEITQVSTSGGVVRVFRID